MLMNSINTFSRRSALACSLHTDLLVAIDDGLEQEAGRGALVLLHQAAVRQHGRQVVAEDALGEGHQVGAAAGRLPKGRRCIAVAARTIQCGLQLCARTHTFQV